MTTKLETVVGYLAGRVDNPALLDELADPSSEASRFLEAARTRSRALLELPAGSERSVEPALNRSKPRNRLARLAWASLGLLVLGATLWAGEARVRRLEATLERAIAEARARSEQIEAALTSLAESKSSAEMSAESADDQIRKALGRVEVDLDQLERQLQQLANRPVPESKPDPALGEIRDQLSMLRRELSPGEKTLGRRAEDLQTSINEVARLVRILVNRSQPPAPPIEAPPR